MAVLAMLQLSHASRRDMRCHLIAGSVALMIVCGCAAPEPIASHGPAPTSEVTERPPALAPRTDLTGLTPGSLPGRWMHGSADCKQNTDPELQVHSYNSTTYILRQNKCRTFEAPFLYLLIGTRSALLLDTGATDTPAVRDAVKGLIGARPLLVAHSHGHGDHIASDGRFAGQPGVTVVANTVDGQRTAFGITRWPDTPGSYELGDRTLDVLAIPGHHATHVAIYDRQTGWLLTGDSVYPGLLFVRDWAAYRASIRRLARFVADHPVSHVLGAHIEMTTTPKVSYPSGTGYQPAEHTLELTAAHVIELDAALTRLGSRPPARPEVLDHFAITPL